MTTQPKFSPENILKLATAATEAGFDNNDVDELIVVIKTFRTVAASSEAKRCAPGAAVAASSVERVHCVRSVARSFITTLSAKCRTRGRKSAPSTSVLGAVYFRHTMKNILIIHSRKDAERQAAERAAYERAVGGRATFTSVSTLDIEQAWDTPADIVRGYDAVIIGGSSDFFLHGGKDEGDETRVGAREVLNRTQGLVEYLVERQIPTLGICFGHQLIAEVFGGAVTHDHVQKKAGTHHVALTPAGMDDLFLGDLAPGFDAQYAHRDSVTRPPFGAVVLAEGEACRFAALRYGTACYTSQFHPELIAADFLAQPETLAIYMKEGETVGSIVRETPDAATLIGRFLERVCPGDVSAHSIDTGSASR